MIKKLNIIYGNSNIQKRKYIARELNKMSEYFYSCTMEEILDKIRGSELKKESILWDQEENFHFMEKCLMLHSYYHMIFVESTATGIEWEMINFLISNWKKTKILEILPFPSFNELINNGKQTNKVPKHILDESIGKVGTFALNAVNNYSEPNREIFYILKDNNENIKFSRFYNDNVFSKLNISVNKNIINLLNKKLINHWKEENLISEEFDYMAKQVEESIRSADTNSKINIINWILMGISIDDQKKELQLFLSELREILKAIIISESSSKTIVIEGVESFYIKKPIVKNVSSKGEDGNPKYFGKLKSRKLYKFTDDGIGEILSFKAFKLKQKLSVKYENLGIETSFAYRKKQQNTYNHIKAIEKHIDNKSFLFYKLDIKEFFNSINSKEVEKYINKWSEEDSNLLEEYNEFNELSKKIISGATEIEKPNEILGFPQGLSPSSVISNIALISLDREFSNLNEVCYTRYSDDILISTNNYKHIGKLLEVRNNIINSLKVLGFEINEKTRFIDLNEESLRYLGANIHKGKKDGNVYVSLGRNFHKKLYSLRNLKVLDEYNEKRLKGLEGYLKYFNDNLQNKKFRLKEKKYNLKTHSNLKINLYNRLLKNINETLVFKIYDETSKSKLLVEISNDLESKEILKFRFFKITESKSKGKFNCIDKMTKSKHKTFIPLRKLSIEEYNDSIEKRIGVIRHGNKLSMSEPLRLEQLSWIFFNFML